MSRAQHEEHYDENDSQGTADTADLLIDRLLEDYKIEFQPEVRLKFKRQLSNITLTAAICKPWEAPVRMMYTIKPDKDEHPLGRYINKLVVKPSNRALGVQGGAYLFSSKIPMWFLRGQFVAGYNWTKKKPTLDWRLTTMWADGPRFKRKEVFHFGERGTLRANWHMEFSLPDMRGHIGRDDEVAREAIDVDHGSMFFEVTQLDMIVRL